MKEASYKKTNFIWFYLYKVPRISQLIKPESRLEVPGSWERENRKLQLRGYKVFVWCDRGFENSGDGCTIP